VPVTADPLADLRALTAEYRQRQVEFELITIQVRAAVLAALRDGWSAGEVADASPYVPPYVRELARADGIAYCRERPGRKIPGGTR
jgi:hypothetical protein